MQRILQVFEKIKKDYQSIFKLIKEQEKNSSVEEDPFNSYIKSEIKKKDLDMGLCVKIKSMPSIVYRHEILYILELNKETDNYWYPTFNDVIATTGIIETVEACLIPRHEDVCNIIEEIKEGKYDHV